MRWIIFSLSAFIRAIQVAGAAVCGSCSALQFPMSTRIGMRSSPFSVRAYSSLRRSCSESFFTRMPWCSIGSLTGGLVTTILSPRLAYFATIPLVAISLGALLTFQEPHLHHTEGRISLKNHLLAICQTIFQPGKTLHIVTVLLATSLLLSVILEFDPLWQLALTTPVELYGLASAAVFAAGGLGTWLSARLTLSKPSTIVGVAGLLVASILTLVVVKNAVIVILAQVVLAAGGVGVSMVFTRLLHDSHSSQMRAGAASGVGALSLTSIDFYP